MKRISFLILFISFAKLCFSQIINEHPDVQKDKSLDYNVWFDTESIGDTITMIRALASNNTKRTQEFTYEINLQRPQYPLVFNHKIGTKKIPAGQVRVLTQFPLVILPDEEFRADIDLFDKRFQLVDSDTLLQGQLKKIIKQAVVVKDNNKDYIGIGGLIIDQTRSKQGHDFYDYFNNAWSNISVPTESNIIIEEMPARGTITRISLLVDNQLIFNRFLTPRASQIEDYASFAAQTLKQFLSNTESLEKQLQNEDQKGTGIF